MKSRGWRGARAQRIAGAWMVALLALGGAAAAADAASYAPRVDASLPGKLRLGGTVAPGTVVTATEQVAGSQPVTVTARAGTKPQIGTWVCGRVTRRFALHATLPNGTTATVVRTAKQPGCSDRVIVEPALRPRPGRAARLRVRDSFALGGFAARVCVDPPGNAKDVCEQVELAAGVRSRTVALGSWKPGRSLVSVKPPFAKTHVSRVVARRAGGFRLLATGDSMIQIIDSYLKARLSKRGGRVTSDAHISTGISKPAMLNWPRHAKSSSGSVKPDVTVMFIGANDGFAINGINCCGDAWSGAYASRVSGMMRTYLRGGQGRVIWLLLPTPRGGNFASVFRGVNQGITQAAARYSADEVTLLDLRKTFTPGGAYRGSITWQGRRRQVRQGDGVHLNTAGASIAADLIIRQLQADGFVG